MSNPTKKQKATEQDIEGVDDVDIKDIATPDMLEPIPIVPKVSQEDRNKAFLVVKIFYEQLIGRQLTEKEFIFIKNQIDNYINFYSLQGVVIYFTTLNNVIIRDLIWNEYEYCKIDVENIFEPSSKFMKKLGYEIEKAISTHNEVNFIHEKIFEIRLLSQQGIKSVAEDE